MITNGWTEELERLQKQVGKLKKTEKWLRGLLNKSQNAGKGLRASIKEAVEEIKKECFNPIRGWAENKIDGLDRALNILCKHGLILEKEKKAK